MFTSVSQEKRISRDGPDKIIWVLPEKIHIPVNRLESLQIILMGFPPALAFEQSFIFKKLQFTKSFLLLFAQCNRSVFISCKDQV